MDRASELRRALPAIREILLRDWDPIGVGGEPAARGEYDRDALALYGMMANGADDAALAAYLDATEREIGLGGGPRRPHPEVVAALRALGIERRPAEPEP